MRKEIKKEHKKIIKYMRSVNKTIASDSYLGLNRFRIDLDRESAYKYPDNSGFRFALVFKLSDAMTGNVATFPANNYNYKRAINEYANDFLIKSSSGHDGHWPPLSYLSCNINTVVPYEGARNDIQ